MTDRHFGDIPGVAVGSTFSTRRELAAAGAHRPLMAGISGSGIEGADSIVLNGGYEDDVDSGEEIIYTGHGGNDPETGGQVADQELRLGNLALAKNAIEGLPVRVIRGWREPSGYGPAEGFRYDGLYRVDRYWSETGRSGYRIWRYYLVRDDPSPPPWSTAAPAVAARRASTIQRIAFNTAVARQVKELHDYHCQVCGLRLETPAGPYAEAAHIRPLGDPHDGPDIPENVLCLCPNHHVLFDMGAMTIDDDLLVRDAGPAMTALRMVREHHVGQEYLTYHRRLYTDDIARRARSSRRPEST